MFSYDGLGRIIKTKFSDTSSSNNYYAYYGSMSGYFGSAYSGYIEKQTYRDEENNDFEKYFDAVGNLRRERKFIEGSTTGDDPPGFLTTDYLYDSLYRISKVKTPEGKLIHYYYDEFGRQSKRITPDAGQTNYVYDKNNNLTYTQDANQRNTDIYKFTFRNYDGLNRLTGIGENIFEDDSPNNGDQFISSNPDYYLTVNVYDTISNSIVNIFNGVNGYAYPNFTKDNLAATAYRTRYTDPWNFKYYRYDLRGRVIKMWNIIAGFDTLITDYSYDSQDQVIFFTHSKSGSAKTFRNIYDYAGRLEKVEFYAGWPDDPSPNYVNIAEYLYNENSQLSQQILNEGAIRNYYFYNNRNRINFMQNSNGIFEYTNEYFLNGNVKSQEFTGSYKDNFTNTSALTFNYKYDQSNRLIETENDNTQHKDNFKLENAYDKDGNILELKRYDGAGSVMDNFDYTYYSNTNKLQRVTGSGTQYTYDANGNMLTDELNQNRDIKYDHRNLITQIRNKKIIIEDSLVYVTYYFYDEAGNRIRKNVYQYIGIQPSDSVETPDLGDITDMTGYWDLIKDEVYSRDLSGKEVALYVNGNIMQNNIWGLDNEGYITSAGALNFYLKDHLGSIRAVTDENNSVISSQDYDAWGYLMQGREYHSEGSVYKFTGKERDKESEYDYFGARYYDSRIGRWGCVDPKETDYPDISPFIYALDNPLRLTDPNGKEIDPTGLYIQNKDLYNQLVSEIQSKTGISLELIEGKWIVKNYSKKGSTTARKYLLKAINSDIKINIFQIPDLEIGSHTTLGGTDIYLNPLQIAEFIDGVSEGLNSATNDAAMFFLHELMHTKIGGKLLDPDGYSFGEIGGPETVLNKIRDELGSDFSNRFSYSAQEVTSGIFIPFDDNARYDLKQEKTPREGSLYIQIYTNFKKRR